MGHKYSLLLYFMMYSIYWNSCDASDEYRWQLIIAALWWKKKKKSSDHSQKSVKIPELLNGHLNYSSNRYGGRSSKRFVINTLESVF